MKRKEEMPWDEKLVFAEGCVGTAYLALESLEGGEDIQSTLIIAKNLIGEVWEELGNKKEEPQPAALRTEALSEPT